jgi:hypothetical protein
MSSDPAYAGFVSAVAACVAPVAAGGLAALHLPVPASAYGDPWAVAVAGAPGGARAGALEELAEVCCACARGIACASGCAWLLATRSIHDIASAGMC